MVKNHTCWWASCTEGLPKQYNPCQSTCTCLCFGSPMAQLTHQHGWFCTMRPDRANGPIQLTLKSFARLIVGQSKSVCSRGRESTDERPTEFSFLCQVYRSFIDVWTETKISLNMTDPNLSNLTDIALQTVTVVITAFDLRLIVAELDRLITDSVLDMHKLIILLKN